jgi:cytochrome oxidase assembly protein ShyY1
MYRFLLSPKWLGFHLLVLLGVIVMVNLSMWQLDRLDARRGFNAAVITSADLPPEDLTMLLGSVVEASTADPRLTDLEWRQVQHYRRIPERISSHGDQPFAKWAGGRESGDTDASS